jgi:hypothetical protein
MLGGFFIFCNKNNHIAHIVLMKGDDCMAEKNRFSKPVAFNKNKPEDQKILKHVSRRNFSRYVKQLIMADIKAKEQEKAQNEADKSLKMDAQKEVEPIIDETPKQEPKPQPQPQPKTTSAAERLEQLKQQAQQKRPGVSTSAPRIFINQQEH